jgi:pseudouridine-5'-phosphate glycosidase
MEPPPIEVRVSRPAVALETAFLTRGLPADVRLLAASRMATVVRAERVEPAFVGVLGGRAVAGLEEAELERLASSGRKLSTRDLAIAVARGEDGGTTVAATVFLAHGAGLPVVATGGIGGVHLGSGGLDVSADLEELARTPIVLVCSGAKAITDLAATMERLETLGVAVVGWRTRELPAFWSAESGIALEIAVESAEEVVAIRQAADRLGVVGAIVVAVPPPADAALPREESERAVAAAVAELSALGLAGPDVTPFLLARIAELTDGRSLRANLALLERNAAVAAEIARALARDGQV